MAKGGLSGVVAVEGTSEAALVAPFAPPHFVSELLSRAHLKLHLFKDPGGIFICSLLASTGVSEEKMMKGI
ncbi:hypothetical protein E2562_010497 [Oryza meyeriana var. granulata]|uniref:Uncharacterized protein n=1 Tax=Oryza meyeriana var. granulata TaxID=110450 RepID=A0A6G1F6T1_9ORYZ|nr:hypothetical protein E2562_010497 [Oryza meyeriana var. granulata]